MTRLTEPLRAGDVRLPAVRARLFLLVRSLWRAGVLALPVALSDERAPAFALLPPLWQRLRVELLGETLLRDILPAIERHMASEGRLRREQSGLSPGAPVDWPATWRHRLHHPTDDTLHTRRWERDLLLPENRLAHLALHALAADARAAQKHVSTPAECAPLQQLHARAEARMRRPPWQRFPAPDPTPLPEATARIRRDPARFPAYQALLAWWQTWQRLHQPAGEGTPLLDPALETDWLFELLLLFELARGLAQLFPLRQVRGLAGPAPQPLFVARTARGPLRLFYQSGTMFRAQRSLDDIRGVPDIVLELPGEPPSYVILDAKNYGPSGHTQAIYKMLGYLYQFGYDASGAHAFERVRAGILAFPTEEREGHGLRNWQRDLPGAQAVMSFVLPPLPTDPYHGLPDLLDRLLEWLR